MDWNIRETALRCAMCAADFREGQEVCSLLVDRATGFERRDYCASCWSGQEIAQAFSHWRTTMPRREQPLSRRVNAQVVLDCFLKLEGEQERRKLCFRYVLGLMLLRKKRMRFGGVQRGEGGEELVLFDAYSGAEYRVYDPGLNADEVAGVTEEVSKVLNIEFGNGEPSPDLGARPEA